MQSRPVSGNPFLKYLLAPAICSHRLITCYGLHQKTSFVSIRPHSSAHSGDSSTQRPTLPSWPCFRTFTWWGLETSSWPYSATTPDMSLSTSGDRPFYRAMVEQRDSLNWLRDYDDDDFCKLHTTFIPSTSNKYEKSTFPVYNVTASNLSGEDQPSTAEAVQVVDVLSPECPS